MNSKLSNLKIKIFADGANLNEMLEMASKSYISGLTTNPTLMRKAGITNYSNFAKEVLSKIPNKPISFEVFSDDFEEMVKQGKEIGSWGKNVYVKIPITNTKGESTKNVIENIVNLGIKVNVTAIMTEKQVKEILDVINPEIPNYISVFAGRIADTGRDPSPLMANIVELTSIKASSEVIWASPRELLNIFQAESIGCQVITATNDILKKLELIDKDLTTYSLDTVKMFYDDAKESGYQI